MTHRCAIVECYNRHDEVYLTTVHLLNRLGYEVHVFNTFRNRIKNSFVYAPHLPRIVHSFLSPPKMLEPARLEEFDLIVFNTFEGQGVIECARQVIEKVPVIGFVHNSDFISRRPEYGFFAHHPHCKMFVLAPYIRDHIASATAAGYMIPVFFADRDVPQLRTSAQKRRFCVQGYFDSTRRQYSELLAALEQLRAEGRKDFEVHVMGRSFSKDFRSFDAEIKRRALNDYVRYSWKGIGYRSYYKLLNSADFILPLISPTSHREYFKGKSTSSVAAAIGLGKVPVLHRQLAEFYGVEPASFTYDDDLIGAMRAALDATGEQLAARGKQMVAIRAAALERSLGEVRQAIVATSHAAPAGRMSSETSAAADWQLQVVADKR